MQLLKKNCGSIDNEGGNCMEIIIYGAGAIGSVYGALLSTKNNVVLIGKKVHVDAINTDGLKITGVINKTYHLTAQTSIAEIPKHTVLLICVKAYDLEEALLTLKPKIKPDTIIVLMQNGLGNEQIAQRILPKNPIVRAVIGTPATFLKPGEVIYSGKATTYLPHTTEGRIVAKLFNAAGMESEAIKDFQHALWAKLIINCVFNPLTSLLNIKNNEIKHLAPIPKILIEECCSVAAAEGIMLEGMDQKMNDVIESAGKNLSSMLQDLMKGKKTEIDFLNGKIVELARKHHLAAPYNEMLIALIKFKEQARVSS